MRPGSVPLARRNVLADRRRLIISVLGVGAALALAVLVRALWLGTLAQTSVFVDNVDADLFVVEAGTQSLFYESSVLPASDVAAVAAVDGVSRADGALTRWVILDLHAKKVPVVVIGAAPGRPGSPWALAAGRAPTGQAEVALDRSLAVDHELGLGDEMTLLGARFTIVGLSDGTRSWMGGGYLFLTDRGARDLLGGAEVASVVLVGADDPTSTASVIERDLDLTAHAPSDLAANDQEFLTGVMRLPVDLMVAIAFAAGTMIVALTVYTAVVERFREYGIVAAMGAGRWRITRLVLAQTGTVTALGIAVSVPLYLAASRLILELRPQFAFQVSVGLALGVVAAAGAMAILAAVVPTRRLLRLDPATVYRGGG
jgi:putative ABC transport system permease protein